MNYEYLNTNFKKYMNIKEERDSNLIQSLLNDLHRTFAQLPVELQPYAEMILNDVNNGELVIKEGWEFTDYLNEYQLSEEDDFIQDLVDSTNINEALLREMLDLRLTEVNINEYSRFDKLKSSVNVGHFSGYIEKNLGKMVIPIKVNMLIDRLLRAFLLEDVFDVTEYIKNYFN
ncbi:TPA: hypothetical protein ACOAUU_002268 [Enterococcus faecium]|nr:hypothetical protein [Enterococcus faecium]MDV4725465.1 hypothetical protein [Enterococcus faecium]MDW7839603.1 hypothetical protein [Enterococcus faecium]MDW7905386.1 hypothetical protein [Enterococcus faecium]